MIDAHTLVKHPERYLLRILLLLITAVSLSPASSTAAIVEWQLQGHLSWFNEGSPDIFNDGDAMQMRFVFDSDAAPITSTPDSATYEAAYFEFALGAYQFDSRHGSALASVVQRGHRDEMQMLIHLAADQPAPGYWIQQTGFIYSAAAGEFGGLGIPLKTHPGAVIGADLDLHTPAGYNFLSYSVDAYAVSAVPLPAIPLPLLATALAALVHLRRRHPGGQGATGRRR